MHGGFSASEGAASSAAVTLTAPVEPHDTLEMAKSLFRTSSTRSPYLTASHGCRKYPMMVAMKKPARLAPPWAAMMMGRGQAATLAPSLVFGLHLFSVIQRSTACSSGKGAIFWAATRRTE